MKLKKLLVLSATCILTLGSFVACNNGGASSSASSEPASSEVSTITYDVNETLKDAADYLWQMYKDANNTQSTSSYTLVKSVYIGGVKVAVSWALEVKSGTTEGIKLVDAKTVDSSKSNDDFQGVYVGYYDFVVQADTVYELTATLSLDGTSKKMGELISKVGGVERTFSRNAKKLVFNTYEEYIKISDEAKGKLNTSCVAAIKGYVQGISSSGKYVYVRDENHAYMVYGSGYNDQDKFAVGDCVAVAGPTYAYNGCYEFVNSTILKIADDSADKVTYAMPTAPVDATTDFNTATNNKDTKLAKYQNMIVTIKNCTLTKIDGNYYYFKTKDGKEFNLYWSTSYFLDEAGNNKWAKEFYVGLKCNVTGMVNCYSNAHQIYPTTTNPIEYTDTDQNLATAISKALEVKNYKSFYAKDEETVLSFKTKTDLAPVKNIEWSIKESTVPTQFTFDATAGTLKVKPTADALAQATLVAKISYTYTDNNKTTQTGTITREFPLNAQVLTEEQQAQKAAAELVEKQTAGKFTQCSSLTLPTGSDVYGDAKISWKLKDGTTSTAVSVKDNIATVAVVKENTEVQLTATVTVGEGDKAKSVTQDVTATITPTTGTLAGILSSKDETNAVTVRGIVISIGGTADTNSFCIYDGTTVMFSYNKIGGVEVGDEVVVEAKYGSNSGLDQLATSKLIGIAKKGAGIPETLVPSETRTAEEIEAEVRATDATANAIAAAHGNKYTSVTGYVVVNSSGYVYLASDEAGTKTVVSIFTDIADQFKALAGKKVEIRGVYRGCGSVANATKGYETYNVSYVKEVTAA